jgi:uncharacterized membrane protein HdeD (DUF308 family)
MLAALFLVVGLFRIVVALMDRLPAWRSLLANGVITALLGVAIWSRWSKPATWPLELFVGIELIVNGVTWCRLAAAGR